MEDMLWKTSNLMTSNEFFECSKNAKKFKMIK